MHGAKAKLAKKWGENIGVPYYLEKTWGTGSDNLKQKKSKFGNLKKKLE